MTTGYWCDYNNDTLHIRFYGCTTEKVVLVDRRLLKPGHGKSYAAVLVATRRMSREMSPAGVYDAINTQSLQ